MSYKEVEELIAQYELRIELVEMDLLNSSLILSKLFFSFSLQ